MSNTVLIHAVFETSISNDDRVEAQAICEKLFQDEITSKAEMFAVRVLHVDVWAGHNHEFASISQEAHLSGRSKYLCEISNRDYSDPTHNAGKDNSVLKINNYSAADVDKSTLELAEAALYAIDRIDTPRLAAMGYEDAAVAVSEARRLLDRLLYERKGKRKQ